MQKILFVLPSFSTGGTLSSFLSIYDYFKCKYDIYVLGLSGKVSNDLNISSKSLSTPLLINLFLSKSSELNTFEKVFAFPVKVLKKIGGFLNISLYNLIYRLYANKIGGIYDIVIGFEEGPATKFASFCSNARKIAWVHCDYSRTSNFNKELQIYMQFEKIVCVSNYTKNVFIDTYPSLEGRIIYIYNILNYHQIVFKSKEPISNQLYRNDVFTIISVGRFSKVKRFMEIPNIAKILKLRGLSFIWYVLGPISKENREDFNHLVNTNELEDCVVHLGNQVNPYPYFRNSDLLVCLSSSEACPMIFNEAKILRLPIVTTDFPSSSEFVKSGFDGDVSALDSIAETIIRHITDSEYHRQIIRNIQNYNDINDNIVAQIEALFDGGMS